MSGCERSAVSRKARVKVECRDASAAPPNAAGPIAANSIQAGSPRAHSRSIRDASDAVADESSGEDVPLACLAEYQRQRNRECAGDTEESRVETVETRNKTGARAIRCSSADRQSKISDGKFTRSCKRARRTEEEACCKGGSEQRIREQEGSFLQVLYLSGNTITDKGAETLKICSEELKVCSEELAFSPAARAYFSRLLFKSPNNSLGDYPLLWLAKPACRGGGTQGGCIRTVSTTGAVSQPGSDSCPSCPSPPPPPSPRSSPPSAASGIDKRGRLAPASSSAVVPGLGTEVAVLKSSCAALRFFFLALRHVHMHGCT